MDSSPGHSSNSSDRNGNIISQAAAAAAAAAMLAAIPAERQHRKHPPQLPQLALAAFSSCVCFWRWMRSRGTSSGVWLVTLSAARSVAASPNFFQPARRSWATCGDAVVGGGAAAGIRVCWTACSGAATYARCAAACRHHHAGQCTCNRRPVSTAAACRPPAAARPHLVHLLLDLHHPRLGGLLHHLALLVAVVLHLRHHALGIGPRRRGGRQLLLILQQVAPLGHGCWPGLPARVMGCSRLLERRCLCNLSVAWGAAGDANRMWSRCKDAEHACMRLPPTCCCVLPLRPTMQGLAPAPHAGLLTALLHATAGSHRACRTSVCGHSGARLPAE